MMHRISFDVPDQVYQLIQTASHTIKQSPNDFFNETLLRMMEDLEDIKAADEAFKSDEPTFSFDEVVQELGLADKI